MIKIAICGNIASGKSESKKILESLGYPVLDTDAVAHNLLEINTEIPEKFSQYNIFENGKISRKKLGELIFSSDSLKKQLENILHPLIKNEILKFFSKNENYKYVFVEIPLVYEAEMTDIFDKIILIYTDDNIRQNRLIKRNHYTKEYAKIRMNAQMSQDEKAKRADIVIYNNQTIEHLQKEILKIIE